MRCSGLPATTAPALGIETVDQDLALTDSLDVTGNLFPNREIMYRPHALGWMNERRMHRGARGILENLPINIPPARADPVAARQCAECS